MANRTVLVVGGSRGIGRACCLALANPDTSVAFLYRSNEQAAAEVVTAIEATGARALALKADVSLRADVDSAFGALVAQFGGLDAMVHCAGSMVSWQPVRDLDPAAWVSFINNDLCGAFHTIQAAVRLMRKGKGGSIVAISSIAAQMCQPRNSQGAAAKAGLEALIRVVAKEEGHSGIRANVVSVGLTDTDMTADARASWGDATIERIIKGFPIARIGNPQEIARAVQFLTDEATYVTGQVLQVDGGQFIAG
ncbi:MAG: SDR family oxidoreductase [Burkholderiaceae bacterium]